MRPRSDTTDVRSRDCAAVRAWRREQLVLAGFEREHAERLAQDGRWDLHALLQLVDRGCTPELAERIGAPLDAGPGEC
jgi:hypothetical protein